MSINGVDYTKQLAKDREYYQDANKKLKDATDKRVEDTEKLAKHTMEKQRDTFVEDKNKLEKDYQTSLNHLKEKTQSSIENANGKQAEDLEKERSNFTQESLRKSADFDQRLNDIKSSYSKAFKAEEDRNGELAKNQKAKYTKNVTEIRDESDKNLKDYQQRMTDSGASIKDQYNRERQQLVRVQEDRLTDVYKDAANKRAELKDRIAYETKKQNEARDAEMSQQRQYTQDRLGNVQKKFQDRYEALTQDYSQRNEKLANDQQSNSARINREHADQVAGVRRQFNEQLRKNELDKKRKDNGSGEFADIQNRQQGLKDQVVHENKIKHLRDELVQAQRNYEGQASSDRKGFNNELKEQSIEAVALRERKLNEANADKIVTVSKEREKAEKQIQNRDHQNRLDKASYEQQLMNERNNANTRVTKIKENFNTSMKELEEKHKASLENVTSTSNKDKADFMKNVSETRANEVYEMKRAFGKHMDAMVQDYEQRLATFQRENEYLKVTMGAKISSILDQTQKQLESQRTLFDDRRAADIKSQEYMMDQREASLKRNFSEMNLTYQKKIDKLQVENDMKMKLITNDYETKLKELKAITNKELAQKDSTRSIELDRLKQAYEDEKTRVVNAYESQIDAMKKGHEEQMKALSDFKRLS